jgi:hypothetical protein
MLEGSYVIALLQRAPAEWPNIRIFRRHVTGVEMPSGAYLPIGIKGQCDLWAIERSTGRHFEIECKNVRGSLNVNQQRWKSWCQDWGVPWIELRVKKQETPLATMERWVQELDAFFRSPLGEPSIPPLGA